MLKLSKYKVTNFRSVMDSGWIDCDDVTTLVGINEAGKSNLLLALWKFNPARTEGENKIDALHDMPRHMYTQWEDIPGKITFATARFEIDDIIQNKISSLTGCEKSMINIVEISRQYDEKYCVLFPEYSQDNTILAKAISDIVNNAKTEIAVLNEVTKAEAGIKDKVIESIDKIIAYLSEKEHLSASDKKDISSMYPKGLKKSATSVIYPKFEELKSAITKGFSPITGSKPSEYKEVKELILSEMPSFVYYSNYGNLDAEIYLPHAVKLLNGEKVPGFDNDAKVRTLRVLFDFVNLNPEEVLELGSDPLKTERVRTITKEINRYNNQTQTTEDEKIVEITPDEEEIKEAERNKEARAIKLDSAASRLTTSFGDWWKQGDYSFDFKADGDYFKIWVSDKTRPAKIELHKSSTGLQWFLSFYLVFLVERQDAHKGAILLLDEAGLHLHPMAQKDLTIFFNGLATDNQIIHTTHSPFLVDTSHVDRVKVVYSNSDGYTVASSDLRAAEDKQNSNSIYPVHAALGLSVSDILINGCQAIIVEGTSDQYYLNAIKLHLISNGKLKPKQEMLFIPSGGCKSKSVSAIISIVSGKNQELPYIVFDSDANGESAKKQLLSDIYAQATDRLIDMKEITNIDNSEIEDLIPFELMNRQLNKWFGSLDDDFESDSSKAIIPQIKNFAQDNNVDLPDGWKVILAESVKRDLQKPKTTISDQTMKVWENLFGKFT